MRIEELTPEQPITFLVVAGEQQFEFESSVMEVLPRKHSVITSPIMKNGKVLSLRGKGVLVHMIVTFPEEKPQIFQNVTIHVNKRNDNSFCYTATTVAESKEFNRRKAFRCFVGIPTSIQVGLNHSTAEAVIKDVSASGFSFTVSSDREFQPNETVHAVINDYIEETAKNYSFHLFGVIVRCFTQVGSKLIYGCKFTTTPGGIERYIMEKERLRLQRSRGSTGRTPKK